MSGSTGGRRPPLTRVDVQGSQGVQIGDHATQYNQYIDTYIAQQVVQLPAAVSGRAVVGKAPQSAPAFQPRAELVTRLGERGPGVPVVRAVTGMRGAGKT